MRLSQGFTTLVGPMAGSLFKNWILLQFPIVIGTSYQSQSLPFKDDGFWLDLSHLRRRAVEYGRHTGLQWQRLFGPDNRFRCENADACSVAALKRKHLTGPLMRVVASL